MIVKTDGLLAALGLPLAHEDMPASREAEWSGEPMEV